MMRGQEVDRRKRDVVPSSIASVLVVEDNRVIGSLMTQYLEMNHFVSTIVNNGVAMDALLEAREFDLIVLNLNLPGEDGLSICRRLGNGGKGRLPIVTIATRPQVVDKIVSLEMGADDCIAIPFNPDEFLARIRAVLRRAFLVRRRSGVTRCYRFAGWHLDISANEVLAPSGRKISLTEAETNLLRAFCEYARCVLTRNQLLETMHGSIAGPFERSIDVLVSRLRKKLGTGPHLIQTIRSAGYVLPHSVTEALNRDLC
jgi:two-component system OmpR family response regulator